MRATQLRERRIGVKPSPTARKVAKIVAADAYLVMTNISPKDWLAGFCRTRQIIGRGRDANVRIPAEFIHVSRQHAEIWADELGCWLRDCNSTFGTRINAVPVVANQPVQLMYGDYVCLGAVELQVVRDPHQPRCSLPNSLNPELEEETNRFQPAAVNPIRTLSAEVFEALTPSELDVMVWMSRGYTDLDEIGKRLVRSPHTVRTHLQNIFLKLGVHSRDQLLACLLRRITTLPAKEAG